MGKLTMPFSEPARPIVDETRRGNSSGPPPRLDRRTLVRLPVHLDARLMRDGDTLTKNRPMMTNVKRQQSAT